MKAKLTVIEGQKGKRDVRRAQLIQSLSDAAAMLEGDDPQPGLSEEAFQEFAAITAKNLRRFASAFCRHAVDGIPLKKDGTCRGCRATAAEQLAQRGEQPSIQ